jgi:hypothetical protein
MAGFLSGGVRGRREELEREILSSLIDEVISNVCVDGVSSENFSLSTMFR